MALRPDRDILADDISFFMNSTASRGGVVSYVGTASSGAAMDQSQATVGYVANPSGVTPVGILMTDVVNLDLTRQHSNWYKEEVQVGGKVRVARKCTVVTDFVLTGHSPSPGTRAWVGPSGYIATSDVATDAVAANANKRVIGVWDTGKDQDGFAKVTVNLPNFT